MSVLVHLTEQSQPVRCEGVRNTYTKGPMFCVLYESGTVDKFPVASIFRIREVS